MYRPSLLHLNENDNKKAILNEHLGIEINAISSNLHKDVYVNIECLQNGVLLDLADAGSCIDGCLYAGSSRIHTGDIFDLFVSVSAI